VPTSITKEHINIVTWLLILMDFDFLGWRNITPKDLKQEVLQLTKDFRVPKFTLCVNNMSGKNIHQTFHKKDPSTQGKHETNLGNSSGGQCHNLQWCISTPVSKSWRSWMHGIGRCHHPCEKASIKHSSQKKVESPRCPS